MWELDYKESWVWRIYAFELWCWRRFLGVSWTAKRSNQSILKEISPEYSLEGLMLKLTLQYFGHVMWRTDSLEKTLILGEIEGSRRSRRQRMKWMASLTQWTRVWVNSHSWWLTSWWAAVHGVAKSQTHLSYWTEQNATDRLAYKQEHLFLTILDAEVQNWSASMIMWVPFPDHRLLVSSHDGRV